METSIQPSAEPLPPRGGAGQLTHRAALSFVSKVLQQAARVITQFAVTPLLIQTLGMPLYGAWMMIQQTMGYIGFGDIRPASTLKFALSVRQHVDDAEEKRRLVGAALRVTLYTLPLLVLVGVTVTWLTPHFIRLGPEHSWTLRVTMAIAIASFAIERWAALPSNILLGSNLDYRSMGMSAFTVLLSGVLIFLALRLGYGLPGVALATAASGLVFNAGRFVVARRSVPWLGSSKPAREELKEFVRMSGGVTALGMGQLVMVASDILLIGVLLGPAAAGMYAATGAVLRFGAVPLSEALGAGVAGISDLCGRREWARLTRVRAEMHLVTVAAMSIVGFVIIALNRQFLSIWSKSDVYAGPAVNFMLVLLTIGGQLYKTDRAIATSLLELRAQTKALILGGSVALVAGTIGTLYFGAAALPAALTAAFLYELFVTGRLIRKWTGAAAWDQRRLLARPFVVSLVLFGAGLLIEPRVAVRGWLDLIGWGVLLTAAAAVVVVTLGLGSEARQMLKARFDTTFRQLRKRAARS